MEKKKFLIAFIGPVGSGKTYIARILAKKLHAAHIRTDDIRIELRKQEKSYASAPRRAARMRDEALESRKSVVMDFDAILAKRRTELQRIAHLYGVKFIIIGIETPEKIISARLRRHRYTSRDFFKNAKEAVRVYYIRRKLHEKKLQPRVDFVINNARPLVPQIKKIIKNLRGLS